MLFDSGIFQWQTVFKLMMVQVGYIVFHPLLSTNFVSSFVLYFSFYALGFIQNIFSLLQRLVPSHHHMNKMWFNKRMSLEPLVILSSKV